MEQRAVAVVTGNGEYSEITDLLWQKINRFAATFWNCWNC